MKIRKSRDRGHFDHGWLKTWHTFSFSDYQDSEWMGFGNLRVMNEDFIAAGEGFPTHGHKDMEIITYVLSGAVAHKDSTGGKGVIRPGEVQRMSAGTGVRHSEYNGESNQVTHLYQIWILPKSQGLKPSYEQRDFSPELSEGKPVLLAAPSGERDVLKIQQEARIWGWRASSGSKWKPEVVTSGQKFWIQIASGKALVGSSFLDAGDAAYGEAREVEEICWKTEGEALIFEL